MKQRLAAIVIGGSMAALLPLATFAQEPSSEKPSSRQEYFDAVRRVCKRILAPGAGDSMQDACFQGYLQGQDTSPPATPFHEADAETRRETLTIYLTRAANAVMTAEWDEPPTEAEANAFVNGFLVASLGQEKAAH